jgi:HEAT repeat protein
VTHGRIYRVAYDGRPLSSSPKIAGEPIEKLLDILKHPEDRVRYRARIELGSRPSEQVVAAVQQWTERLTKNDKEHEHHLMEALWLHQNHNVVNEALLRRMLSSPDFRARAAATRVLCYWRDQVSDALNLLKKQAADEHPRVRLEAVRASSSRSSLKSARPTNTSTSWPRKRCGRSIPSGRRRSLRTSR